MSVFRVINSFITFLFYDALDISMESLFLSAPLVFSERHNVAQPLRVSLSDVAAGVPNEPQFIVT